MAIAGREQARQLLANLVALGPRRLGGLAAIGLLVFAAVGLGGYFISRPVMETLYSGLDRTDVTRIGAALTEAGIPFDVSAKGDAILTTFAQTANARMLLAEKGLPRSENAGYELFDNLGSIGLTSFMQEVTRVRALEGEIARTIQTLKNVRAARVHIVLPDEGSFRRERQKPSASVVIRTESADDATSAQAIRHLVAAAIPGMTVEEVTVLSADGTMLASGDDSASASPGKLLSAEKVFSHGVEESIRRTLTPYLGVGNFQSSVATRLDTDRRQINERIFDPDGRVERSTRTVRETGQTQNSTTAEPASVDQNVPEAAAAAGSGKASNEEKERREELTNYEINEKTISTTSDGYEVKQLSIAVVIDRQRLREAAGADATDADVEARLKEIEALVMSAAGYSEPRGDQITVTAVDFVANGSALDPVPSADLVEMFARQSGTLINAATILTVAVMLIWFGLKPAIRALVPPPAVEAGAGTPIELENGGLFAGSGLDATGMDPALLQDLTRHQKNSPQARLEQLLDFDEAQAASILKQWIHQKEAA